MLHHAMYVYPKAQSNKQYIHDNSRNRERTQDADHTPTDDNNEIQKGIDKSRTQNAKDIHPIQQCRTSVSLPETYGKYHVLTLDTFFLYKYVHNP